MKRVALALGVVLGVMAACVPVGRPPLLVRYNLPDERFWPKDRDPLGDLARAAELPPLSVAHLPPGARELRISDSYSMFQGGLVPAVRVVEQDGVASGEVLYFWFDDFDAPKPNASSCSRDDRERVCVYRVPESEAPDWQAVAAELSRLGAWEIQDYCEDLHDWILDGGELYIDRRDKDHFSRYNCNGPSFRDKTEAGRRAAAIYHYFETLTRYRGAR